MIVATGTFDSQPVTVTWVPGEPLAGPSAAVFALIDDAADLTGTEIGVPTAESIDADYLDFESGFRFIANRVLGGATFHYPNGEPPETDDDEDWLS